MQGPLLLLCLPHCSTPQGLALPHLLLLLLLLHLQAAAGGLPYSKLVPMGLTCQPGTGQGLHHRLKRSTFFMSAAAAAAAAKWL
jgi:hypothetical protein